MGRIDHFGGSRFVGTRDDMRVHDCDDEEQFVRLQARVESDDLYRRNLLAAVAPDTLAEARNRGYHPISDSA